MNNKYFFQKENLKIDNFEYLNILFDNDEILSLSKEEIDSYNYEIKDKLIREGKGTYPVISKGEFVFRINEKYVKNDSFLYDEESYLKDKKDYIINKCLKTKGIKAIEFVYESFNYRFYGNFKSELRDNLLCLFVDEQDINESLQSYITLPPLRKDYIQCISLDFDDCECFEIYKYEIEEIDLKLKEELIIGMHFLERVVIGGYIKIRLKYNPMFNQRQGILLNVERSDISNEEVAKKLTSQKRHYIGNLFITYNYPGLGYFYQEKIEVQDIGEENDFYIYGTVDKEDDTFIIRFGK